MIKRLVIHRFRGIRQGAMEDLGKINLLIGPNNSGKTAILEMLYLAGVVGRECEVLIPEVEPSAWKATTLNRRDFLYQEPMLRIRTRHGEPRVWKDSPAVLTDEYTLRVELPYIPSKHPLKKFILAAPPEEGGLKPIFGKQDISQISLFRLSPHKVNMPEPLMPRYFGDLGVTLENTYWVYLWEEPWVYQWEKKEPLDYFAVWALEGQIPNANHILLFDFHTAETFFEQEFAKRAYKEVRNWESRIAECLGKVFPELEGARVNLKPYINTKWTGFIEFPDQEPIQIDHFGDGARHAFKVLASLIALREQVSEEKPGLFLWEDPEMFMHPATLGRLLEEVLALIKDVKIQTFISTQSLEVITWLTYILIKRNNQHYKDLCKIYHLNLEKGQLLSQYFDIDDVLSWLEGGLDLREIETGLIEGFPLTWKLRTPDKGGAPW